MSSRTLYIWKAMSFFLASAFMPQLRNVAARQTIMSIFFISIVCCCAFLYIIYNMCVALLEYLDADVAVPDFVAVVLHAEVAGLLAAVLHDFVCEGPVLLAELGGLHEVNP